MKRFFDKLLLSTLWLLSVTLAITFWMNMNYGFDVLSAPHWEYLATLQSHQHNIKPDFYISLIAALFIALIGLYLIMRPRSNRTSTTPTPPKSDIVPQQPVVQPTKKPEIENKTENNFTSRPAPAISLNSRPMSPMGLRPVPMSRPMTPPIQPAPSATPPILNKTTQSTMSSTLAQPTQNQNSPEIQKALESNDYIIKKCDRIGKLQNPTVAITYDQKLWIVTTNASPDTVLNAIQTLVTLFDDTLGETANDIRIRGFIINSTEPLNRTDDLIMTFGNISDFVKYVGEHKNEKPDDYDAELFEAFSTYISTVTGYIGKV